jgi:hypothetical protein
MIKFEPMEIILKVTTNTFGAIKKGILNEIKHGYSKNKKYLRLFDLKQSDKIVLKDEQTFELIKKTFKSISIIEINDKKVFKLIFE